MADERQWHEQEIYDVKHKVELLRQTSDRQLELHEGETRAVAEVRKVVGQLTGHIEDLQTEDGHNRLGVGKWRERTTSCGGRPPDSSSGLKYWSRIIGSIGKRTT
jgi:hypothetical protein